MTIPNLPIVHAGMLAQSIATDTLHVLPNPWLHESTASITADRSACGQRSLQWFAYHPAYAGRAAPHMCATCARITERNAR